MCGKLDNFGWLQTNSSTIVEDLNNRQPVVGGNEDAEGEKNYWIGAAYENKTMCIGHVLEVVDADDEPRLHCVNKYGRFWRKSSYKILV